MKKMKDINELKIEKREEYMSYIKEHIDNVKKAFNSLIESPVGTCSDGEIRSAITYLKDNHIIDKHDESKYSDEEFEAYRKYFFSVNDIEKDKEEFENAWKHHYEVNDHHPEHWMNEDGTYNKMTTSAIIEMICDWEAMGYKFGNSAYEYYTKNKAEKSSVMHPETIQKLEYILNLFK